MKFERYADQPNGEREKLRPVGCIVKRKLLIWKSLKVKLSEVGHGAYLIDSACSSLHVACVASRGVGLGHDLFDGSGRLAFFEGGLLFGCLWGGGCGCSFISQPNNDKNVKIKAKSE